jgi:hypothetical protein
VDVFFEENFFGNTYCPAISLKGQEVNEFLDYVWKVVKVQGDNTKPNDLINSNPFKKLLSRFPTIDNLLKNQVNGMIAGAINFKHDYLIIKKRIVYKDNDTISYKLNYGYKTVFAYLHEY